MSLNRQQFPEQQPFQDMLPGLPMSLVSLRAWDKPEEYKQIDRQKNEPLDALHFTESPDFKPDPAAKPEDVLNQGGAIEGGIGLFATQRPHAWRGAYSDRPYAARLRAAPGSWRPSRAFPTGQEYHLDPQKTQVLGIHRSHIFRSPREGVYRNWEREEPTSGPKVSPTQPRQPMLPGMGKLRASRARLTELGRTNR